MTSETLELSSQLTKQLDSESAQNIENQLNEFHQWMKVKGKEPAKRTPLSESQSRNYVARMDQVFRFATAFTDLDNPVDFSHTHADQIIRLLDEDRITQVNGNEYAESSKRKFANAIEKYFLWRHGTGERDRWKPNVRFSQNHFRSIDKLNFRERGLIRAAALEYRSLPSFYDTSESERERINTLVAQRIGKPKDQITGEDWRRDDISSKIGSLVGVGLDTGILAKEVGEAEVSWYRPKQNVLVIPHDRAAKERPNAELPLSDQTGEALSQWIRERRHRPKYDATQKIWLNQAGNPYNSNNLCYLVRRLCQEAGIPLEEDRKISWYSIRHSLGQSMDDVGDLSGANDQLRHESIKTTKDIYGESSIEHRRSTLNQINLIERRAVQDSTFDPFAEGPLPGSTGATQSQTHIDSVMDSPSEITQVLLRMLSGRNEGDGSSNPFS